MKDFLKLTKTINDLKIQRQELDIKIKVHTKRLQQASSQSRNPAAKRKSKRGGH